MPDLRRILDANANRAREALRVMEDAARFVLDDAPTSEALKSMRHDLSHALSGIAGLDSARDTPGDVGTTISTETEQMRGGVAEVVIAAGKRLSEALRSIEEYAKALQPDVVSPQAIAMVEQLRYRGYALEQTLNQKLLSRKRRQWRLCLLLTESLCALDWREVLRQSVEARVDCVQVREKELTDAELLEHVREVIDVCRPHGVSVIVNDRADLAMAADADGVHLGQTDLSCTAVRQMFGKQLLVGVSTSRLEEAEAAHEQGADYCGVGPMFPTTTKHKPCLAGPDYLREYLAWGKLPHLAIGGITPENVGELPGVGVAVSAAICAAEEPGAVCAALIKRSGAVMQEN